MSRIAPLLVKERGWGEVLFTLFLASACLLPAQGQTRPDPFGEEAVVVRARRIETVSKGVLKDGVIVIRNGKITAVGTDVKIPPGARILRADTVMPGIVGAYSQIGISAAATPSALPEPRRFGPGGGQGGGGQRPLSNPHYRVRDELYPFDENYARLLRYGVTTLSLAPAGRGVAGQGALVRPQAETAEKMPLVPDGPLTINFAPNTQTMDLIRTTFDGARPRPAGGPGGPAGPGARPPMPSTEPESAQEDPEEDMQRGQGRRPLGGRPVGPANLVTGSADVRREPVLRALQGTLPTLFTCGDAASVTYLMPLLQSYTTLKPVYVLSSGETYRIAALLGSKNASVIFPAELTLEPLTINRINIPALLAQSGVKVALRPVSDTPEGYQTLRYQVGELIKTGLDRTTALRAITLAPAEMLGLGERVGSIDIGRDANLLLLDGDPFVSTTRIRSVLLEGKTVYEE